MTDVDSVSLSGSAVFIDNDLTKTDLATSIDSFVWKTTDDLSLNEEFEDFIIGAKDRLANLKQIGTHRADHTLAWLDPLVDSEDLHTQEIANKLSDTCKVFNDPVECFNYIMKIIDSVILIISGSCALQCLQSFHSLAQVDFIVIYCARCEKYLWMSNVYEKVVDCMQTEKDLIERVHHLMDIKCQTPFYIWRDVTKENAGFMWSLINVLLRISNTDHAKEEMLGMCRTFYQKNPTELANIDEFKATYSVDKALWWYTRDSFLYKSLNKAMRTENMEAIYHFRSFIADLHNAVKNSHAAMQKSDDESKSMKIYRGMLISSSTLYQLQNNLGGLVSTNGFLSTTRSRDVALMFIHRSAVQHYIPVLLEITADLSSSTSVCFADISKESCYPDEEEILFDIGTVFEIESVYYKNVENVWNVILTPISVVERSQDRDLCELLQIMCLKEKGLEQKSCFLKDFFSDDCIAELAEDYFHCMFELKTFYRKMGSNYSSDNVDNYKKALSIHEKAIEVRRIIFSRYSLNCSGHTFNNSNDLPENVDNSYGKMLSIYEQGEKLCYAFYLCFLLNQKNFFANIDTTCCSKDIDHCTGECLYHQKRKRSSHHFVTLKTMNMQNLKQKLHFKTPILCFNLGKNHSNKEEEFRSKWFSEFQTIFIADALQITQQVLRCHVDHQQFYLITCEPIPAELNSLKTNSLRIYYLNANSERENYDESDRYRLNLVYVKTIEHLVCRLYFDLGQYFNNIAEQFLNQECDSKTAKQWFHKSSRCYELLAQSTKDIIDYYGNSLQ